MNHVERVQVALARGRPDRVPAGEFELEPGLVAALLGREGPAGFAEEVAARELLGMDLLAVTPQAPLKEEGNDCYQDIWGRRLRRQRGLTTVQAPAIPAVKEAASYRLPDASAFDLRSLRRWREETDFFIFAFVDGPFQGTNKLFDFTDFLLAVAGREGAISDLAAAVVDFNLELARLCVQAGAHGLLIGDDIAYERGTYIHPDLWREIFLPLLRRQVEAIKAMGVPVLYHSDGNLQAILPDLAALPLDGIQCLEPAAGMDIGAIKKKYGGCLCLMGNFDLNLLATGTPETITAAVEQLLLAAAPGGGYIFSTSSGILGADLPPRNVLALYQAVAKYGAY
ncbi:Uroporphyrinogen decarboxylase (URO-D) [Moorella glycerini]|uniref:Methylcobalamin:coenzyme M methyltransferase n=1 Tax=Neomoorella stamsii TaxID=1266720 RepID=A0A9X7J4D1_9FIRM|nr:MULTISPECIES: uroporphyrinogen decarboxylase family protein [Moorella]PRR74553.1 methylcobalamin:coenzyme M methyltransferase [Moorella stamsii]CEP69160.1 Uroporphyrinogen decarboxylase (URO-D) [Moorella glycerini]